MRRNVGIRGGAARVWQVSEELAAISLKGRHIA